MAPRRVLSILATTFTLIASPCLAGSVGLPDGPCIIGITCDVRVTFTTPTDPLTSTPTDPLTSTPTDPLTSTPTDPLTSTLALPLSAFSADGSASGTGTIAAIPLPATLPLFASGLGALGLLCWR